MSIVVYWLEPGDAGTAAPPPRCALFGEDELTAAMGLVEQRRREGMLHVSLSTDFPQHVGRPGVDAVEGGRTPDGQAYDWSKAGRAGKVRRR